MQTALLLDFDKANPASAMRLESRMMAQHWDGMPAAAAAS